MGNSFSSLIDYQFTLIDSSTSHCRSIKVPFTRPFKASSFLAQSTQLPNVIGWKEERTSGGLQEDRKYNASALFGISHTTMRIEKFIAMLLPASSLFFRCANIFFPPPDDYRTLFTGAFREMTFLTLLIQLHRPTRIA